MTKKSIDVLHHHNLKKKEVEEHNQVRFRKYKNFFGKFVYVVGIFGPIMTLPQLYKIWIEKNASGVSVISWSAYLFVAVVWVLYGLLHKQKPIVLVYSIWIILDIFIVIGTILY